jgi:hypothetical protein
MNRFKSIVVSMVMAALVAFAAVGCEKEGPAEKAGKKVDEALDSAKESFKKMTDD